MPPDEVSTILEGCPDVSWRTLVALARLAGLRCPSETHILTWADVGWDCRRLEVRSPKTERYEKHRRRTVPITPKLMRFLQDAFDAAEDGQGLIIELPRNNLYRNMRVILKRAGVEPFGRCFQVLRQSCETEWAISFPQHVVSGWLGHSEAVSREHYLQIPDEVFDRAAGLTNRSEDSVAGQSAAECAAAHSRTASQGLARGEGVKSASRHGPPSFVGSYAENDIAPGMNRTYVCRIGNPNPPSASRNCFRASGRNASAAPPNRCSLRIGRPRPPPVRRQPAVPSATCSQPPIVRALTSD